MKGDVTPDVPAGRQIIEAYGGGGFRISGVRHQGSVIVMVDRVLPWPVAEAADLGADSVAPVIEADVDVELLLVGCGPDLRPLPVAMVEALRAADIAAEPMDTGAACRTYNVLLAEERHVAAALMPSTEPDAKTGPRGPRFRP